MAGEEPFCLDMATATVSWNRVLNYRRTGEPLPSGWAADATGLDTADAGAAAMLQPLGGYKGFGLGMAVEILCSLLADGPAGSEILPMFTAPLTAKRHLSHFFLAVRVDAFVAAERFAERLADLARRLRAAPAAAGNAAGVLVPGTPRSGASPSARWPASPSTNPSSESSSTSTRASAKPSCREPMTVLVDVVNFNADGSCLAAERWLASLEGGEGSAVCRWLGRYVAAGKPVTLGFVGGTVADLVRYNPQAIALVNAHPELFELVLRPFSHDVGLLRTAAGFRLNFECGREIVQREFRAVLPWYLPPEFMLNNEQVTALAEWGVVGTFVNADRFKDEVQRRLPPRPYLVSGVLGGRLPCVPFAGRLADAYLDSLHRWSGAPWNEALGQLETDVVYSWRDGESFLLLPDGEAREACGSKRRRRGSNGRC